VTADVDEGGTRVVPFGDEAVLVTLGDRVDPEIARRARALVTALDRARADGIPIRPPVLGYASLLVSFDLEALGSVEALAVVARIVERAVREPAIVSPSPDAGRLVEIPTRYDGEDLSVVAELTGLSEARVVEAHTSTEYEVYMLGFAPGFAYLGVLPPELAVPRRPSPRPRVPRGSVAIAERQTAVYSRETPGGWRLIGRTDVALWDARADRPALLAPGDRVRFVPVP
jgi:KipI family sensor histidine kinase inhibitor